MISKTPLKCKILMEFLAILFRKFDILLRFICIIYIDLVLKYS